MIERIKKYIAQHRTTVGFAASVCALFVAATYFIVVPLQLAEATGVAWLVLRYGHSLCWVLLSVACVAWALGKSARLVKGVAIAALCSYILFMLTLVLHHA